MARDIMEEVNKEDKLTFNMSYCVGFTDNLVKLIDLDLSKNQYKVLWTCVGSMDNGNKVTICKKEIADKIGISMPMFYTTLKKLKEKGIMAEVTPYGYLYINANLFSKGLKTKMSRQTRESFQVCNFETKHFDKGFW